MDEKVKKLILAGLKSQIHMVENTIEMIRNRGDQFNSIPIWEKVLKEYESMYDSIENRK